MNKLAVVGLAVAGSFANAWLASRLKRNHGLDVIDESIASVLANYNPACGMSKLDYVKTNMIHWADFHLNQMIFPSHKRQFTDAFYKAVQKATAE